LSTHTPAELKRAISGIDKALDVVDLLVVLLKICRRHASEVVAAAQDSDDRKWIRQECSRLQEDAASAFTSIGLSVDTKKLIRTKLEAASNLAVTARALALGIDQAMRIRDPKAYVKLCAKWPPERILEENDPYPTPSVELTSMYGDVGFSRRPRRSSATAFDRVDGLALWSATSEQPLRVIYDTNAGALLDSALGERETVTILAVLPNQDFVKEFQLDDRLVPGFFRMHPIDTAGQDAIMEEALRKANTHDVDILVTPELSSTDNTVKLIEEALAKIDDQRGPRVVIAGGLHVLTGTQERRNRLSTVYNEPNSRAIEHDKIGEYIFSGWEEPIDRSTELRIHAGMNWSMIPLICADLLDDAVVDAVADLCPRMVIVPSMSSKTGDFEMSMGAVIRKTQSLVMVVNGPPDWPYVESQPKRAPSVSPPPEKTTVPVVVIGMPFATSWITQVDWPRSAAKPLSVLFRSDQRGVQFI
jgi:hypothetical protein